MSQRPCSTWLPRLLFWVTVGAATGLLGVVLLAPVLDPGPSPRNVWTRLWALFAHDALVRRTAVASAVGLYVTAGVFFRPGDKGRAAARRPSKPPPPPVPVVGA